MSFFDQLERGLKGEPQKETPKLTHHQQRARLTEWWAAHRVDSERFEPGDFVKMKMPGMSMSPYRNDVAIFDRYLPEPLDAADLIRSHGLTSLDDINSSGAGEVADCVVFFAAIGRNGQEAVIPFLFDSRLLTRAD